MRLLLRSLLFTLFAITFTSANVFSQSATITTDQPDYAPGSTAIITGSGWQPGETVTLQVLHDPTGGDDATSPAHQPWTVVADAAGNVSSQWVVPAAEDELGATLKLTADGQSSGVHAEWVFTDANSNFSYTTTSGKTSTLTTTAGTTDNTTISVDVTAAKNNGSFNASLSFSTHTGTSIGIGTGAGEINLSSITNSYNTSGSDVTHTFPITVSVGASVPDGSYYFDAVALATGMTNNKNWTFVVIVGSTPGSIGSVSVEVQSGLSVYGTASTPTFNITSMRAGNGTVNGTYNVTGLPTGVTSGGFAPSATFTATGSNPFPGATLTLNVSPNVNSGSYNFTVSLSDGGTPATATGTLTVAKADPTSRCYTIQCILRWQPHTATYTISGVNGETGATVGTIDVSATTHTDAGTYNRDTWNFTGAANYNNTSGAVNDFIDKATSTTVVTINGGPFTYTGLAQTPATVSVTGAGGLSLTPTASYTNNINAGTATASYTYAGDANHTGSIDGKTFDIGKADATGKLTGYTYLHVTFTSTARCSASWRAYWFGYCHFWYYECVERTSTKLMLLNVLGYIGTYDAAAHGATGSSTETAPCGRYYAYLGASFTDVPGGTAHWSFSGGTNYNDQSGDVAITINKADATVNVSGYTGTYDAAAHGATGSATGVDAGGTAAGTTLDLGSSFTDVPGGTAHWSFSGGTNYNDQSGDVAITINKADATVNVSGYTGTYDAAAHGATGAATGVDAGGTAAGTTLDLGASFTDVPGGTAHWSFSGGTNYNDQSGDVAITINKADATVNVSGYTGTYDAAAHGATGAATGVDGDLAATGSTLDLGASFTDVPGGTAHWSFSGGTCSHISKN